MPTLREQVDEIIKTHTHPVEDYLYTEAAVDALLSLIQRIREADRTRLRGALKNRADALHFAGALKEEKGVKEALQAFDTAVTQLP